MPNTCSHDILPAITFDLQFSRSAHSNKNIEAILQILDHIPYLTYDSLNWMDSFNSVKFEKNI